MAGESNEMPFPASREVAAAGGIVNAISTQASENGPRLNENGQRRVFAPLKKKCNSGSKNRDR